MEAKEVLGEPGRNKVFAGGTAGKQHALPREISYGLGPTGPGTWAYKPQGEVAGDAVENDDFAWPHRDGLIWPHFASVVVGLDVA